MAKKALPTDEEIEVRSLLMRLYHSHFLGEASYPAIHVNGHAPELQAKGWIESAGDGWKLTDAGITAWAEMNRQSLGHVWAMVSDQFQELRQRLGITDIKAIVCSAAGCRNKRMVSSDLCVKHWQQSTGAKQQSKAKRKRRS